MPNEKQAGPDMSVFLAGWMADTAINSSGTEARLDCPAGRPLILEMKVNNANLPEKGHICLLRATTRDEELWAVRVTSAGSLKLQPGTGPISYLTLPLRDEWRLTGPFELSVSFDPILGGIVLATDFTKQVLAYKCRNAWADFYDRMGRTPEDTYQVTVGCPLDGRADQPPLGWTISAKYRFGPKYAQGAAGVVQDLKEEREEFLKDWAADGFAAGRRFSRLLYEDRAPEGRVDPKGLNELLEATCGEEGFEEFKLDIREALRDTRYKALATEKYTATDAALHRLYTKAAEGADHTELSAEWHLGVVAGARSQGWQGGKP